MPLNREGNLEFWLALLKFGEDEGWQRLNWNTYCCWKYEKNIRKLLPDGNLEDFQKRLGAPTGQLHPDIRAKLKGFEKEHGSPPAIQGGPSGPVQQFMDFSEMRDFTEGISFAGRILIDADFRGITFHREADFAGAEFLGATQFEDAEFRGPDGGAIGDVSFMGARFHGVARFGKARFLRTTRFDDAVFGTADFRAAEFMPPSSDIGLGRGGVTFRKAKFRGEADFDGARFRANANFNNAEFQDTTSFRGAAFGRPPKFFETKIHEDVDFSEVDWSDAEESYKLRLLSKVKANGAKLEPGEAVRAWDRMALIMSRQEKLPERHEFFRLKMRAQRWRDGPWHLSSIANWVFDNSSDYGWGISRAFFWWGLHIVAGAGILTVSANCPMMAWNSLLVSFSNSLAFLRLGRDGGFLDASYSALDPTGDGDWLFNTVGTVQAILGPILLFLVLLTLRNRFRLG